MNRQISGVSEILIAAVDHLSLAIASYSDGLGGADCQHSVKPQGGASVSVSARHPLLADDVAPQPVSHSTLSKEVAAPAAFALSSVYGCVLVPESSHETLSYHLRQSTLCPMGSSQREV